ncbi:hypothetical protein RQP46_009393 [Phenoliferia psychrophenolica]
MSNIWTAASEGDFERVKELVEAGKSLSVSLSPRRRHYENTYTPLHAAASWNHFEILRYLVAAGGDINTTDSDNETPLFVVETAEMARTVVELGGDQTLRNTDGLTAAEALQEEQPHISLYLRSLSGDLAPLNPSTLSTTLSSLPEDPTTAPDLDAPTDALLQRVRVIMEASERGELTPEETDDRLREVVESAVGQQVEVGREIGTAMEEDEDSSAVRPREEEDEAPEAGASVGKRRREEAGR